MVTSLSKAFKCLTDKSQPYQCFLVNLEQHIQKNQKTAGGNTTSCKEEWLLSDFFELLNLRLLTHKSDSFSLGGCCQQGDFMISVTNPLEK